MFEEYIAPSNMHIHYISKERGEIVDRCLDKTFLDLIYDGGNDIIVIVNSFTKKLSSGGRIVLESLFHRRTPLLQSPPDDEIKVPTKK